MNNISRRDFLKGSAAAAASFAAASVLGGVTAFADDAPAEVEVVDTIETEIAIVGGGAAGLMCAVKAARAGKKITILEKGFSLAVSNFANCGGPGAAGTSYQAEAGESFSGQDMFEHMYNYARGNVNGALLRKVTYRTGEAVDTMRELGIDFSLNEDVYGMGFRQRHQFASRNRIEAITAELEKYDVEIRTSTEATKILMEDGKCVGVQCKTADGYINVMAKAVLVCTGGFQGNPEMINKIFGGANCKSLGNNLSSGDAIRMIEEVGGYRDRNFAVGGNEGSATTTKIEGAIFNFAQWEIANQNLGFGIYGGLLVNLNGERFTNEKKVADLPLAFGGEMFIQNGKTYAIVDSAMYDACTKIGIYEYYGKPESWVSGPATWFPVIDKAPEQFEEAVQQGWAWKADTIEELAETLHLPKLVETVAKYNEYCESGVDEEFGKEATMLKPVAEGPFYAFEYEGAAWCTIGGLKCDSKLRVIKDGSQVIDGLYVGGLDAGSLYTSPYYDGPGSAVGLACGSGILAAECIMEYLDN